jgi:hypothetical protein
MAVKPEIQKIESEIFTPAMQQAMKHSMDAGNTLKDSILGAANAYLNMLIELVGKDNANEMLENQTRFLKNLSFDPKENKK